MRVRSALAALALGASLVLTACSGDDDAATTTTEAAKELPDLEKVTWTDLTGKPEVRIIVRDNTFAPQYVEISPGTVVTFDNRGRTGHNAITSIDGGFESVETEELDVDMSAERTFDEPGDYPYYCSLHGTRVKGMYGAIRVVES